MRENKVWKKITRTVPASILQIDPKNNTLFDRLVEETVFSHNLLVAIVFLAQQIRTVSQEFYVTSDKIRKRI